ncbi:MAG: hypothetical protein NVSMB1_18090 [Polyangiales bacterium]
MGSMLNLAGAAAALAVATTACGFLPKKVTKDECDKWGDHFVALTKDASANEVKKCMAKLDPEADLKAAESAANKAANAGIDKLREDIVKGCVSQEGKSYIAKDADCYMKAKALKDWKSCDFKTPFFTDFSTLSESVEKDFQANCDEGLDKAKRGAADREKSDTTKDKGDKKRDKKEKKGDDDE